MVSLLRGLDTWFRLVQPLYRQQAAVGLDMVSLEQTSTLGIWDKNMTSELQSHSFSSQTMRVVNASNAVFTWRQQPEEHSVIEENALNTLF